MTLEKRQSIKTFGRKNIQASIKASSSCTSPDAFSPEDKNLALQRRIDEMLVQDQLELRQRRSQAAASKFDEGLSSASDPEFDEFGLGLKKPKAGRSFHEIVEAGENNRFFDEIEYLVDGLSLGSFRSRIQYLEELMKKIIRSSEFGSRMRAHGMLSKAVLHLSDLVVSSSQARAGVCVLLITLCHDIRKIDAFILPPLIHHLVTKMLESSVPFPYLNYLHQAPVFKDILLDSIMEPDIALWVLAKYLSSGVQLKDSEHLLNDSTLGRLVLSTVRDSKANTTKDLDFLKICWANVYLELFSSINIDSLRDLVGITQNLAGISSQACSVQRSLALLSTLKTLVTQSGLNSNAVFLSKNENLTRQICQLTCTILPSAESDDCKICVISILLNLVDRNEEARELVRIVPGNSLDVLAQSFLALSATSLLKMQLGLLLAVLVHDNRSNQVIVFEMVQVESLCNCVSQFIDNSHLHASCHDHKFLDYVMGRLQALTNPSCTL